MGTEHDPDRPDPPHLGTYGGVVTDNADPLKLGRIRARVPGKCEPQSGWAFPKTVGGGSRKRGVYHVPPVGADVQVTFHHGDVDVPLYECGQWGRGDSVTPIAGDDVSPEDAPSIVCWETEKHLLVFDARAGKSSFHLYDKETGDGVLYDGVTRQLEVHGTVGVSIRSEGVIDIRGLTVTINGRPVTPGGGPI